MNVGRGSAVSVPSHFNGDAFIADPLLSSSAAQRSRLSDQSTDAQPSGACKQVITDVIINKALV
jgi:hypothetical protein